MEYRIELQQAEPQPAAVMSAHVTLQSIQDFLSRTFCETIAAIQAQGLQPAGMPFGRYIPAGDGLDVVAGFPCSGPIAEQGEVYGIELPGALVATTIHVGSYGSVADAYSSVAAWLSANGYISSGVPWESYLDGPEVAEPRTLVSFPCIPKP